MGAIRDSNITINEKSGAGPFDKPDDSQRRPSELSNSLVDGNLRSHRMSRNIGSRPGDLGRLKTRGFLTGALGTPRERGQDKPLHKSKVNDRIFAMEQKLETMGVLLPITNPLDPVSKLRDEAKSGMSAGKHANSFLPPYGGHT